MKYGIIWYVGVGEHDYEEEGRSQYATMAEMLTGLHTMVTLLYGEDLLFDALDYGRQEAIYWVTDTYGFAFYRP